VYRFLATPRWIGFALLAITATAVMIGLGLWQLDRYHIRHAINTRIDQANASAPAPLSGVLPPGQRLPSDRQWTRVKATGVYDAAGTVVARDRTVNDQVGFEILTPLVLDDGSRIIIDRGWVPLQTARADQPPPVPPTPSGRVTVEGRLHLPESSADAPRAIGDVQTVRRIAPSEFAGPGTYVDYLLLDKQAPKSMTDFTRIPADRQPSWMNAGYTVQWFAFALLALCLFAWAARREAHDRRDGVNRPPRAQRSDPGPRDSRSRDRLGEDPTGGAMPPATPISRQA
jgi:cytochrome oxidase assembly protein ShyY1